MNRKNHSQVVALFVLPALALGNFRMAAEERERSFIPFGESVKEYYLIAAPKTIAKDKKHPLIVFLHGRGGNHKMQWTHPALDQFREFAAQRGYFTLSPDLGTDNWMNARARRVLRDLLDDVLKTEPVDPNQVFIMGMSMGGGGALTFAAHHPDRIRAVCNFFGEASDQP